MCLAGAFFNIFTPYYYQVNTKNLYNLTYIRFLCKISGYFTYFSKVSN